MTDTAMVVSPAPATPTLVDERLIIDYMDAMGIANTLDDSEKKRFIKIAKEFQLNPFKREIYATKYGKGEYVNFSIITGYEVYLKRAERTGKLAGWEATVTGSIVNGDLVAKCTIWRHDWSRPLTVEAWYEEYVQTTKDYKTNQVRPNRMWAEKPKTMIRKVAIAQCFRMAFPDELGGMPYTMDEMAPVMPEPDNDVTIVPAHVVDEHAARLEAEKQRGKEEVKEKRVSRKDNAKQLQQDQQRMVEIAKLLELITYAEIKSLTSLYKESNGTKSELIKTIIDSYENSFNKVANAEQANVCLRHIGGNPEFLQDDKAGFIMQLKRVISDQDLPIIWDETTSKFIDEVIPEPGGDEDDVQ